MLFPQRQSRTRRCNVVQHGGSTSICTSTGSQSRGCNTQRCRMHFYNLLFYRQGLFSKMPKTMGVSVRDGRPAPHCIMVHDQKLIPGYQVHHSTGNMLPHSIYQPQTSRQGPHLQQVAWGTRPQTSNHQTSKPDCPLMDCTAFNNYQVFLERQRLKVGMTVK